GLPVRVDPLDRRFLFDLTNRGVCYGAFTTDDARKMADVIGAFVVARMSVDAIEQRFPWIRFDARARAHERGRLVDHEWHRHVDSSEARTTRQQEVFALLLRAWRPRRA